MTGFDEGEIEIFFFNVIDTSRLDGFKEDPSGI